MLVWLHHYVLCDKFSFFLFLKNFTFLSFPQKLCLAFILTFVTFVVVQLCSCGLQHARPPCPSPSPGACSNSHPSGWWCYPTISSSGIPFSSCLQSFPASGSFPMSWLFGSKGQSIRASNTSNEYSGLISFRIDFLNKFPLGLILYLVTF